MAGTVPSRSVSHHPDVPPWAPPDPTVAGTDPPLAGADSRRAHVSLFHGIRRRWAALLAAAIALPLAAVTTHGALSYWPDRAFPGFFVLPNALVPTIGLREWTGTRAAVPFHARIVAVDDVPLQRARDVYDHAARLPVGTPVRYTLAKEDEILSRTVPTMRFTASHYWLTLGAFLVFGLLSVGAGVVVAALQPDTAAARAFLSQGFFAGVFGLSAPFLYQPDLWGLTWLHNLSQAMFPAAFIHFGLTFPEERPLIVRHPTWIATPYLVSAVLTVWMLAEYYAAPPDMTPYYVICVYSALSIVVLVGLVTYAYWENRTPTVRPRLNLVLPALVLATTPAVYGFLNIARAGGDFPMNVIAFSPVLFYAAVGYAIVKHDLFDIDTLVKQAAVYGTLTLAITAAYAASLGVFNALLPASFAQVPGSFNVAFIVLVAILFHPLRAGAQRIIDRTFYRSRLDFRRTVVEVSAALTSLLDLDEILERVGRTLSEGLQVRALNVVLWLDDRTHIWRYDAGAGRMVEVAGANCVALHARLARAPRAPLSVVDLDAARAKSADGDAIMGGAPACRDELAALDATLLVPLTLGETVIGGFALGARRSGRPFSRDDLELLSTLAAESAIAVQNARSYRALQALNAELEAKVDARTAELSASNAELARAYDGLKAAQAQLLTTEKMASLGLIVAGVAHEINNPVSFIIGNVEPLHQTFALLRTLAAQHQDARLTDEIDRLAKILGLMALGAERTAAIVQDLRTFSRLGEAQPRPTDLQEGIEVSLRLLRPRWADRITIHREYGVLAPVEVIPGQINQVFINVLANACDAIRERGNLWIRTAAEGGHIVVAIRDDGPGIPPEQVARVFDPFFTTKPMGQGTGLGLAITQGIVSHHGGTIEVTSQPGHGTEFRIVLPLEGVREADDERRPAPALPPTERSSSTS